MYTLGLYIWVPFRYGVDITWYAY